MPTGGGWRILSEPGLRRPDASEDVLLAGETVELIERFCHVLERLGEHNTEWVQLPLVALAVDIQARANG